MDPRPNVGISPYSAFGGNPIRYCDPLGDTSVPAAGGGAVADIDETQNQLEFYNSSTQYYIKGTTTAVPVQAGQLRSFKNSLGTFTARWRIDENGKVVLKGLLATETKLGGKYKDIPKTEFFDNHEMPSKSVLKKFGIPDGEAPAVQMETPAHNQTGSYMNSRAARIFREKEAQLIREQKFDELWNMLESDYKQAMDNSGFQINSRALEQAKTYYYKTIVPKLTIKK